MRIDIADRLETIQSMLKKIDRLYLPSTSRCDLESILVRQVAQELDRFFPWQAGHALKTATIVLHIGQAAHLHDEFLHQLKLAALLHDIGFPMLPLHLQTRQDSLVHESYIAIQSHPRLAATLLEPFSFLREATNMIAHHHEHWDGSGYPYGVRGTFIPLGARILAVADAFDAIHVPGVSDRSLRDHIALRILRVASGSQFDPSIVEIFCGLMEEQPRKTVEQDNTLRGKPAYAQRRSQSGSPTAPTLPAEVFTSRGPQPPLPNTDASWHRPDNNPLQSRPAARMLMLDENSVIDNCPLQTPHIESPLEGWDAP